MNNRNWVLWLGVFVFFAVSCTKRQNTQNMENEYVGSGSCIECHEKFYDLWSPSHHGKAMQPVNAEFVKNENLPNSEDFSLEGKTYKINIGDSTITMVEMDGEKSRNYDVVWVLGGKNVYYFLTPLEKGKLQTIPLAYNLNDKAWYNNPQSALRHFPEGMTDQALPWRDRMYNFNSSCYSCHVSQLQTNFDLTTDTYNSTWNEPGINCETCHGPSGNHVRIFKNAKEGEEQKELGLISTSVFTPDQHNWSCAPCHAKMHPITPSYMPGEKFFDNYDLTVLNNTDFYPDGRDLGENYTYTGWMMNVCNDNGQLHCVMCHTSSGRDRFKDKPNDACIKSHAQRISDFFAHSGHEAGSPGAVCINCHMPKTVFGNMNRSDHSFRPPMPEATILFDSPNACNMCHTDKSAEWANNIVKKRKNGNYQEETMKWAELLKSARLNDWSNLRKILEHIEKEDLNEVVTASFIRTLGNCNKDQKWATIIKALKSKSPLVRSSAAAELNGNVSAEAKTALLNACTDEIRLVRISAASSLALFPKEQFTAVESELVAKATQEYMTSVVSRPDDWSSHYNLGLFYQNQGDAGKALESYETAARLYPESLMPLINSSVLYSYIGNTAKAEENLKKVLVVDPENEAANLNLGLLLAEQGKLSEAEQALRTALRANPSQAVAAYNLSVISASSDIKEAVDFAKIAAENQPEEPKYAYTLAFYQVQNNQKTEAIKTLNELLKIHPQYLTAVSFLADIYMKDGKTREALKVYQQALETEGISDQDKASIQQAIVSLQRGV
ncbi:MAG: ammonia-forming cytochrome c nitrite reductase subunit c552 [Draconibacterium sp.]|nr:ammonia-forming cytochrome c nitrite reductase subunit c552 [Draconibacterium sp.]